MRGKLRTIIYRGTVPKHYRLSVWTTDGYQERTLFSPTKEQTQFRILDTMPVAWPPSSRQSFQNNMALSLRVPFATVKYSQSLGGQSEANVVHSNEQLSVCGFLSSGTS